MPVALSIEIEDPTLDPDALIEEAETLLDVVGRPGAELSLLFVDDVQMRSLNRDYRGLDRTTDVLSFSQTEGEGGALILPEGVELLGDVVISPAKARRQCSRYHNTFEAELRRLLVHGVLHLLGYDHVRTAERAVMRAEERRVLAALRTLRQDAGPGAQRAREGTG